MKITITCDCGQIIEFDQSDIYVRDTTPCSCGQCRGESYTVSFGKCPQCDAYLEVAE